MPAVAGVDDDAVRIGQRRCAVHDLQVVAHEVEVVRGLVRSSPAVSAGHVAFLVGPELPAIEYHETTRDAAS